MDENDEITNDYLQNNSSKKKNVLNKKRKNEKQIKCNKDDTIKIPATKKTQQMKPIVSLMKTAASLSLAIIKTVTKQANHTICHSNCIQLIAFVIDVTLFD